MACEGYDPDHKFRRFRVVEFPVTLVGLSSTIFLDIDVNLKTTSYIKTLCEGKLVVIFYKYFFFHIPITLLYSDISRGWCGLVKIRVSKVRFHPLILRQKALAWNTKPQ